MDSSLTVSHHSFMTSDAGTTSTTSYLARHEGQIVYEVAGQGPLIVLVPDMGDLLATYRFLAPQLRRAAYRVAECDLRGHGDSDVTFSGYGDEETASDLVALIDELSGPAVVAGNSMGAAAAVLAAADRPDLVVGLVLVGPFLRDRASSFIGRFVLRLALSQLLAATTWRAYMPKLYAGRRPDDFEEYRDKVVASLRRPGYAKAFSMTARGGHRRVAERLGEVAVPSLVVMGEKDPDFADPRLEADWIAKSLGSAITMVPRAGHYPQSQQPETTTESELGFLVKVHGGA